MEGSSSTQAPPDASTSSLAGVNGGVPRGWDPTEDNRFRVSLVHRFAEEKNVASSAPQCIPENVNLGTADLDEPDISTPTNAAPCNVCVDGEPRLELELEGALVNAINSAYTSSGYPFVVSGGNTRGAVYGSYVDLRNPILSSLDLPPRESILLSPSYSDALQTEGVQEVDTLLRVQWSRGARIMTAAGTVAAAAVAASQSKASGKDTKPCPPKPVTPASRAIAHHLSQYPEGLHGVHSSLNLASLLVDAQLPTEQPSAPSTTAPVLPPERKPQDDANAQGDGAADAEAPPSPMPSNIPPPPRPAKGASPIQHTLICASTFNHITVYFVAHQDGRFLYLAPIQTLSASIATRKITAHQLILIGREEISGPLELAKKSPSAAGPSKRSHIPFADVPLSSLDDGNAVAGTLLKRKALHVRGSDAERRTISVATAKFTVEPHLLLGNQNGDIFVFSPLQEKVVQHINYSGGSAQVSAITSSSNSGVGRKLICSPVSCIAEVQCGIEKKIATMIEFSALAKRNDSSSFQCDDTAMESTSPSDVVGADATAKKHYYYPVPPSLYAVGFDNGQVLLICVTVEGGWMLRHFNQTFGMRSINAISVRIPSFFTRLWTSTMASLPPSSQPKTQKPQTTIVSVEGALLVHEEEQHIAAVSCHGGVITLVRLPGMDIISSLAPYDYNAVGEILSLQWTASSLAHLLTPDILVASGEDDTMTAFQLLSNLLGSARGSSHGTNEQHSRVSSSESALANGRLRVLEKKRFHHSWVKHLTMLPLVMPSSPRQVSGWLDTAPYIGTCLIATSYDHRTSFWPYMFTSSKIGVKGGDGVPALVNDMSRGSSAFEFSPSTTLTPPMVPEQYVLVDGPTAAHTLHKELVLCQHIAGGGRSFFFVSICCQGKVKFWSVTLKLSSAT